MELTIHRARVLRAVFIAAAPALGAAVACTEGASLDDGGAGKSSAGKSGAGAGGAAGSSSMSGGRAAGGAGSAGKSGAGAGGAAGSSAASAGASTTGGAAGTPTSGGTSSGSAGASAGRGGSATGGGGATSGGTGSGAAGASDGGMGDGGTPGTTGGCAGRDLLICEDFESTNVGSVPSGWTRHGDLAAVSDEDKHGGSRALRLGAAANSERRIYHDAAVLGSAHWGRIYYKVETPVPDAFVHSTMVSLTGDGPQNGNSDYRPIDTIKQAKNTPDVGGRHNFIFNVQIIGSSEFGTETSYDYTFDAKWHCAEYHIQASNQSYELYLDGTKILGFEHGAGNYDDSDIPNVFDEIRVGWINYQSASPGFTAWIDDVAFDDMRIGCD
ncbi:MAG TPA: hypothetical protein VFV94_04470 [Polyangiaceae bacterium]|jgi:hypothetical protein|nr:hypothetical protein [Polyangiaceae bacterium]